METLRFSAGGIVPCAAVQGANMAFRRDALPRSKVHWVEPRLVGQVGFSEWTSGGELRHPRFQGLRTDKDPADVVREIPADSAAGS